MRLGNELKGLRALADAVVSHPRLREFDVRCCALGWKGGSERDYTREAEQEAGRVAAWQWAQLRRRQQQHADLTHTIEAPARALSACLACSRTRSCARSRKGRHANRSTIDELTGALVPDPGSRAAALAFN